MANLGSRVDLGVLQPGARQLGGEELHEIVEDPAVGFGPAGGRLHALARGVLTLPAEQRAALVLRELEGLSYEQIAQALGVTVPAVKGRIHRARLGLLRASATWR